MTFLAQQSLDKYIEKVYSDRDRERSHIRVTARDKELLIANGATVAEAELIAKCALPRAKFLDPTKRSYSGSAFDNPTFLANARDCDLSDKEALELLAILLLAAEVETRMDARGGTSYVSVALTPEENELCAAISMPTRTGSPKVDENDPIGKYKAARKGREDSVPHLTPKQRVEDVKARGETCYGCGQPLGFCLNKEGIIYKERTVEMHNPSLQECKDNPTLTPEMHMGHNYCNSKWSNRSADGTPVPYADMKENLNNHLTYVGKKYISRHAVGEKEEFTTKYITVYFLKPELL
jgi:hypothetical protein